MMLHTGGLLTEEDSRGYDNKHSMWQVGVQMDLVDYDYTPVSTSFPQWKQQQALIQSVTKWDECRST